MRTIPIISNCLVVLSLLNGAKAVDTVGFAGMVASPHTLASQAGQKILQSGGTAADAALAVQLALNVVEPSSSGIGGGSFILYYESDSQTVYAIDGSVEAPDAYNPYVFCDDSTCFDNNSGTGSCHDCDVIEFSERKIGGLSIGVPGTLAAFKRLHEAFGTSEWADLFEDAIDIAGTTGFTMYQDLYDLIEAQIPSLSRFNSTCELLLNFPDCDTPKYAVGETVLFPDFAATLTTLSASADIAIDAFYSGDIAAAIVAQSQAAVNDVTARGGVLVADDIDGYAAVFREPIYVDMTGGRTTRIYGANVPSSALTVQYALQVLALSGADATDVAVDTFHDLFLAQNIGFACRFQFLADQDFVDIPVEGLLDESYLQQRADDYMTDMWPYTAIPFGSPEGANETDATAVSSTNEGGGTYFAIYDQWGNMASVTSSIEGAFGSSYALDGYGFLLNNALTGFTAQGMVNGVQVPNGPEGGKKVRSSAIDTKGFTDSTSSGGKRPLSAMSPLLIQKDDEPYLAIGAYGVDANDEGESLIGTTVNVMAQLLLYNKGVQEAVDAPRLWGQDISMVDLELSLWEAMYGNITNELVAKGYSLDDFMDFSFGGAVVLQANDDGLLYCGQDTSRWATASCLAVCDDTESVCPYAITTAYPLSTVFEESTTTESVESMESEECEQNWALTVNVNVFLSGEPTVEELQQMFASAFQNAFDGEWDDDWCADVPLDGISITALDSSSENGGGGHSRRRLLQNTTITVTEEATAGATVELSEYQIAVTLQYNDELADDTFLGNADADAVAAFESDFSNDILETLVSEGFTDETATIRVSTAVASVEAEEEITKLELVNFITIVSIIDVLIFCAICIYLYSSFRERFAEKETVSWGEAKGKLGGHEYIVLIAEVLGTILRWVLVIYGLTVAVGLGVVALLLVLCGDVILIFRYSAFKKLILYQIPRLENTVGREDAVMARKVDIFLLGCLLFTVEDIPVGIIIAVVLGDQEGWNAVIVLAFVFSIISIVVKFFDGVKAIKDRKEEDEVLKQTVKEVELAETTTTKGDNGGESKEDEVKEEPNQDKEEVKEEKKEADKDEVKEEPKEDEDEVKEEPKEETKEEPKTDGDTEDKADNAKEAVKTDDGATKTDDGAAIPDDGAAKMDDGVTTTDDGAAKTDGDEATPKNYVD